MRTSITFIAFMFHLFASVLWMIGFCFRMTAFGGGELVGFGRLLFVIHNAMMSPIVLMEYYGFPFIYVELYDKKESLLATIYDGSVGPYPSIASIIWSFIVGYAICRICSKSNKNNKPNKAAHTNPLPAE